jgi:hypothetical protein
LSSQGDHVRCTELGEMPTWRLMLRTIQGERVFVDVLIRSATLAIFRPSSRKRMICARKPSRCALVNGLARRSSSTRTSALAIQG